MTESLEVFRTGRDLVQMPGLEEWRPNFQYQIARAQIVKGNSPAAKIECRLYRDNVGRVSTPVNLERGARLFLQIGDLESAQHFQALARREAALHPDSLSEMELHSLVGEIALASVHLDEAIQEQRSALTFRDWYTPYFSLGNACEAAGRWDCAVKACSQYLDF